jgi:hypothetical protein
MCYFYINLSRHGPVVRLDPDEAIIRLQELFPEAIVLPGDQLALAAQRTEQRLGQSEAANRAVIQKLWWDAQHSGPAYAFYVPPGAEPRIEGVIKRYQADFHSEAPLSSAMRARIVAFLRSLIPAGVAINVGEERDEEEDPILSPP